MTEKVAPLPKKPMSRIVTIICDHLPAIGKIKEHKFVTTLGAGVKFEVSNHDHPGFNLTLEPCNQYWTAQEMRELSDELLQMAKYLDKIGKKPANQ